jgi:N-methylhydantoinase B
MNPELQSNMKADIDPITLDVIKNALDCIADELAIIIMRSSYSAIVRDTMDYSTAICDRLGRLSAQGLTTALHLGSFPGAMEVLIETYGNDMNPGDVFITNDPYGGGGMHLPDIYVIKPIFVDDRLEGFATTLVHHTDVGGIAPGAMAVYAHEIYQEGIRIPLTKLYDKGQKCDIVFQFIEKNVRVPHKVLGDLRAQIAACKSGEKSYRNLVKRYGGDTLFRYQEELLDYSERLMRETISQLIDGEYHFTDVIDGLGDAPEKIIVNATVIIKGSDVTVDFDGTSPQVRAAINAPGPWTHSATYFSFRCLMGPGVPNNIGYMRPIKVLTPKGSIVNPYEPAACNARGLTGFRISDAVLGALAQAVPERIFASGEGGCACISFGGQTNGESFVFAEGVLGCWGGRNGQDGLDGAANMAANQSNQPIELIEIENPIEIVKYGFVDDSGGPGEYRGGLAIIREYKILEDNTIFTNRTDRRKYLPYGLAGGRVGTPCWIIIDPEGDREVVPVLPLGHNLLHKGQIVQLVLAGGGGYGDPLDRAPELVLQDVSDGKISQGYAERQYGVVLSGDPLNFDMEKTNVLRDRFRQEGKPEPLSHVIEFEETLGVGGLVDRESNNI